MRCLSLFQSSNARTSGFSLLALSDVARHGGRANNLATTRLDQRHGDGDVDDGPVLPLTLRLVMLHLLTAPKPFHDRGHLVFRSRRYQDRNRAADDLGRRVSIDAFGAAIPGNDRRVHSLPDDGVV